MTAFLHSVMIQEKRGMLKRWNMSLVITTFLLSIFGTFITRSGVIASVHSFAQSNVGYFFLAFLVAAAATGFILLYTRWPRLEPEAQLESMASREAAFLFNNLVLVGIAFSVLWGTLFPILSEAVRGVKITVGPPFFNRVNIPLGLLLLLLTGIGPLIAWRKASTANLRRQFIVPLVSGAFVSLVLLVAGVRDLYPLMTWGLAAFVFGTVAQEFYRGIRARRRMFGEPVPLALARLIGRNRRRYGGYLVHLGVLVYFVAFAGSAFKVTKEVTLVPGERTGLVDELGAPVAVGLPDAHGAARRVHHERHPARVHHLHRLDDRLASGLRGTADDKNLTLLGFPTANAWVRSIRASATRCAFWTAGASRSPRWRSASAAARSRWR